MKNIAERYSGIDIAKGIGIIMVVWAHAEGPFSRYINHFHMPYFFFISGYLFRLPENSIYYVKNKTRKLLVPFWKWNYILLIPFWGLYYWGKWDFVILAKYTIEIALTLNKVPMLGATWFLPSLFFSNIFFLYIFQLLIKYNDKLRDVILGIIGLIICVWGVSITYPYRISRTMICFFFYVLGYIYKKYLHNKVNILLVVLMALIYLLISTYNEVDLGANKYENGLLFVVGAILASISLVNFADYICRLYEKKRITKYIKSCLKYLGKNSMPIVIWHLVFFRMAIVLQILLYNLPVKILFSFPIYDGDKGWWFIYIIVGIVGSLMWDKLINIVSNIGWHKKC